MADRYNIIRQTPLAPVILLIAGLLTSFAGQAQADDHKPPDEETNGVKLNAAPIIFDSFINGEAAIDGTPVQAHLKEAIKDKGRILIPESAPLLGHLEVKEAGKVPTRGKNHRRKTKYSIKLVLDEILLADGSRLQMKGCLAEQNNVFNNDGAFKKVTVNSNGEILLVKCIYKTDAKLESDNLVCGSPHLGRDGGPIPPGEGMGPAGSLQMLPMQFMQMAVMQGLRSADPGMIGGAKPPGGLAMLPVSGSGLQAPKALSSGMLSPGTSGMAQQLGMIASTALPVATNLAMGQITRRLADRKSSIFIQPGDELLARGIVFAEKTSLTGRLVGAGSVDLNDFALDESISSLANLPGEGAGDGHYFSIGVSAEDHLFDKTTQIPHCLPDGIPAHGGPPATMQALKLLSPLGMIGTQALMQGFRPGMGGRAGMLPAGAGKHRFLSGQTGMPMGGMGMPGAGASMGIPGIGGSMGMPGGIPGLFGIGTIPGLNHLGMLQQPVSMLATRALPLALNSLTRRMTAEPEISGATVPESEQFPLTITRKLETAYAHKGETFEGILGAGLNFPGYLSLPKGSHVIGHVSHVEHSKRLGKAILCKNGRFRQNANLSLELDEVITPEKDHVQIAGSICPQFHVFNNEGNYKAIAVGAGGKILGIDDLMKPDRSQTSRFISMAAKMVLSQAFGNTISFGAMPAVMGLVGAFAPFVVSGNPVEEDRTSRTKGFVLGATSQIPGGAIIKNFIYKGEDFCLDEGDELLAQARLVSKEATAEIKAADLQYAGEVKKTREADSPVPSPPLIEEHASWASPLEIRK